MNISIKGVQTYDPHTQSEEKALITLKSIENIKVLTVFTVPPEESIGTVARFLDQRGPLIHALSAVLTVFV